MNPNVKRHEGDGLGWQSNDGIHVRNYSTYDEYVARQSQKLTKRPGWCKVRSDELRFTLGKRLEEIGIQGNLSVLCLGARLGGEVQAFIDAGCFAVGIDLNPGERNPYVLPGDFHAIQFADNSVNIVYINCIDHCIDLPRLLAEIHRVLTPRGRLIAEFKTGSGVDETKPMGSDAWDCLEWDSVEVIARTIKEHGFVQCDTYYDRERRASPHGRIFRSV